MPPKGPSSSLVPKGKRDVISKDPSRFRRGQVGPKPTTERALVLRKSIMGGGEVLGTMPKKLSGREKLDLLAGALVAHFCAFFTVLNLRSGPG